MSAIQTVLQIIRANPRMAAATTAAFLAVTTPLVAQHEGLRLNAYKDPVGIPTICYGETKGVRMGDTKTKEECDTMLAQRLLQFRAELAVCAPSLTSRPAPTQAALVSWAYNVGTPAACKSTLVRKLNAGDLRGACNELNKWVYATKAGVRIKLRGLETRRAEERELCLLGLNNGGRP